MSASLIHQRYTVDEYEQMIATGAITENDRVELIRGEVREKMPIGKDHMGVVNRLNRLFGKRLGDAAIVSVQNPLVLEDSEPEPDIALLAPRDDFYGTSKPVATDVLLLVEVADSSLDFDRDVKLPLYAQAGIAEYWIVNLPDDRLEVYRQPQADGSYAEVRTLYRGDSAEPRAFPNVRVTVEEVLG